MRELGQKKSVDHFAQDHTAVSPTLVHCNFQHMDYGTPSTRKPKTLLGMAIIIPPYSDATVTTGFHFWSTHIYDGILYFDIICGSCNTKRPSLMMNK